MRSLIHTHTHTHTNIHTQIHTEDALFYSYSSNRHLTNNPTSSPVQTHSFRQNNLRQHWGFTCTCTHCTAPESQITLSDDRTTQIRDLWAILDDYSTTIPTTTPAPQDETTLPSPEKADRLIALYREEGLDTRMVEAYYRAAVENNGVGRAERAREFAGRAVREGEIMEAGIRPFLENMRALARDPEGHWTWRFRLRGSG